MQETVVNRRAYTLRHGIKHGDNMKWKRFTHYSLIVTAVHQPSMESFLMLRSFLFALVSVSISYKYLSCWRFETSWRSCDATLIGRSDTCTRVTYVIKLNIAALLLGFEKEMKTVVVDSKNNCITFMIGWIFICTSTMTGDIGCCKYICDR